MNFYIKLHENFQTKIVCENNWQTQVQLSMKALEFRNENSVKQINKWNKKKKTVQLLILIVLCIHTFKLTNTRHVAKMQRNIFPFSQLKVTGSSLYVIGQCNVTAVDDSDSSVKSSFGLFGNLSTLHCNNYVYIYVYDTVATLTYKLSAYNHVYGRSTFSENCHENKIIFKLTLQLILCIDFYKLMK